MFWVFSCPSFRKISNLTDAYTLFGDDFLLAQHRNESQNPCLFHLLGGNVQFVALKGYIYIYKVVIMIVTQLTKQLR